ncbi:MAG TPA: branched-chain amino acid ABC transporter permease [Burkholderiaceae bacterium]|nr:branched-chain amino acid ABC transporter permease [Burkholderiaceae bacterium]
MLEIALFTLSRGAIYALVAVGFVLVFSVGGVLNLAHGTLFMLGGYFTYLFYESLFGGRWLLPAIALAVLSTCVVAALLYTVLLHRRLASSSYVMVMSLSVALFVEQCLRAGFGATSTGVPALVPGSQVLLGVRLLNLELLLFPLAVSLLAALWLFLRHTALGRSIVAVAQNRQGAVLVGMDASAVIGGTVVLSAGLAAFAGAVVSPTITVVPTIWAYWLVKAFAIAILGGLGSLPGAVVAAFALSFAEVATTFALSDQFADLVALLVIVAVLILRPSGLFAARSL